MRLPILLLVAGVPLLAEPQATLAQAGFPWCSIKSSNAGPGGRKVCAYESWDQCMATVQSIGGFCVQSSLSGPHAPGLYYRRPSARRHKRQ